MTNWKIQIGFVLGWLLVGGGGSQAGEASSSEAGSVVVIFNQAMPESREVAYYYAKQRQVPTNQVFGFDLPTTETMTRRQYMNQLQEPLLRRLEKGGWLVLEKAGSSGTGRRLREASIRYLALCYGVPIRIQSDPTLHEPQASRFPESLRKNQASVDSQLAVLPAMVQQELPWVGLLSNPGYGATNTLALHPTNGVFLVSRLDGPTPEVARGLVDLAMRAEADGLWGRAYFDLQNTTNQALRLGDQWIRQAADVCRRYGYTTVSDTNAATLPVGYPLSHVAIYAGWYGVNADGPFLRPQVEFVPGAFAYHLHSFSASTLRSKDANWVGPLLDRGAAATMGTVYEPYINFTSDLGVFFSRWLILKFSYAEAAWASIPGLSWQNLVVGDPLYRPFKVEGRKRHEDLAKRKSPLLEWSFLQVVNRNLVMEFPPDGVIGYLEKLPMLGESAVLKEKLADLYVSRNKLADGISVYEEALDLKPSPQQKVRLLMQLAQSCRDNGSTEKALGYYDQLLENFPEYRGDLGIREKMLWLARQQGDALKIKELEQIVQRLSGDQNHP